MLLTILVGGSDMCSLTFQYSKWSTACYGNSWTWKVYINVNNYANVQFAFVIISAETNSKFYYSNSCDQNDYYS